MYNKLLFILFLGEGIYGICVNMCSLVVKWLSEELKSGEHCLELANMTSFEFESLLLTDNKRLT